MTSSHDLPRTILLELDIVGAVAPCRCCSRGSSRSKAPLASYRRWLRHRRRSGWFHDRPVDLSRSWGPDAPSRFSETRRGAAESPLSLRWESTSKADYRVICRSP